MSVFFLHNAEIYGYMIDTSFMTLNAQNVITFNGVTDPAVPTEAAARIAGDATNATATAAEATARATAVTNEATARATADTTNANAISAETTARTTADTTNANAISAETTRATTAEALMLRKLGVVDGSNASAGQIGEYISSTVLVGSAVPLTNNTAANVTSISLTAGDWDVWGTVNFNPAGTTTIAAIAGAVSTTSATFPTAPAGGGYMGLTLTFTAGFPQFIPAGRTRISIASTTTVYLVAQSTFGVSTMGAYGFLGARRVAH